VLWNSNQHARKYAKNATKMKQSFENSSCSADAKQHKKTKFYDVNITLQAWFKKTGMNNP
jgi:hypothetical protein